MATTTNAIYSCHWGSCSHAFGNRAQLYEHMEIEHLTDDAISRDCKVPVSKWEIWREENMLYNATNIAEELLSILEKIDFQKDFGLKVDPAIPRRSNREIKAMLAKPQQPVPSPTGVAKLLSEVTELTRDVLTSELYDDEEPGQGEELPSLEQIITMDADLDAQSSESPKIPSPHPNPKTPSPPPGAHDRSHSSHSFSAFAALSSPTEYAGSLNASPALSQLVRQKKLDGLNSALLPRHASVEDDDEMEIDPNDPLPSPPRQSPEPPQQNSPAQSPPTPPPRRITRARSRTPASEPPKELATRVLRSSSMTPRSKKAAKKEFVALKKRERGVAPLLVAQRRYTSAVPAPGEAPDAPIAIPDTEDEDDEMQVNVNRKRTRSVSRAARGKRTRSTTPDGETTPSQGSLNGRKGRTRKAPIQVETIVEEDELSGELAWPSEDDAAAPETPPPETTQSQKLTPPTQNVATKKFRTGFLDLSQPRRSNQTVTQERAGPSALPTPASIQEPLSARQPRASGSQLADKAGLRHSPASQRGRSGVPEAAPSTPNTSLTGTPASLRNPLSQVARNQGPLNQNKTTPSGRRAALQYTIISKSLSGDSSSPAASDDPRRSPALTKTAAPQPQHNGGNTEDDYEDEYSQLQLLTQAPYPSQSFDDSQ